MERFRRRPCQPALLPASQIFKTEGESLLNVEKSWSEELSGGETSAMQEHMKRDMILQSRKK